MLEKIGDNAVILVAAILTICGVMLALQPWNALNIAARISMESAQEHQQPPQQQFQAAPGEVAIGIPPPNRGKTAKPKPH